MTSAGVTGCYGSSEDENGARTPHQPEAGQQPSAAHPPHTTTVRRDPERSVGPVTVTDRMENVKGPVEIAPADTAASTSTTVTPETPTAPETSTAPQTSAVARTHQGPTTETRSTATTTARVALPPTDPCTLESVIRVVGKLLEPYGIPMPDVELGSSSYYQPGGALVLETCARKDVIAHELGHYIMQRANGSFAAHIDDAGMNFCPGGAGADGRCISGWIRGNELYPGIEHAAHCVGNVLAGYGAYTKCPETSLFNLAQERLRQAR